MNTSIAGRILDVLFPETCPSCGQRADRHDTSPFCHCCWDRIVPYTGPLCQCCGLPFPSEHGVECADCLASPPDFTLHRSFGLYEGTLREAIHRLKYGGLRRLARPLAGLFLSLDLPMADVVVPVPLHPARLRQREFNQSALIGASLARQLEIPLDLTGLVKTRNTPPQVGLSRRERLENERNAFRCADGEPFAGKRVLLVDDVCTTASTIRVCASALDQAGASDVFAFTLARSTPDVWNPAEPTGAGALIQPDG